MAHKDDAPAISLFSFQDIITSLTGIMFLVVLLLVLQMSVMQKKENTSSTAVTDAVAAVTEHLKTVREQLNQLKEQDARSKKRIRELEKMDLDTLSIRLDKLRQEDFVLQTDLKKLKDRYPALVKELERLRELQMRLTDERKYYESEIISMEEKLKDVKEKIQKQHAQTMHIRKVLKYTMENTSIFTPILVECTETGVRILDCSNAEETDLRSKDGTPEGRRRKFTEWVQNRAGKDEYYTVFIKPESFDYNALIDDLEDMGKQCGLELLPEDSISLFQEK